MGKVLPHAALVQKYQCKRNEPLRRYTIPSLLPMTQAIHASWYQGMQVFFGLSNRAGVELAMFRDDKLQDLPVQFDFC